MKTKLSNIALEGTCSGDVVGGLLLWTGEGLQALFNFEREETMDPIITVAYVSAISTAFIAIFAGVSLWLAFTIRAGDKMYRRQVRDLFEAIVISNILSNPEANLGSIHLEERVKAFKDFYRGETPIFD